MPPISQLSRIEPIHLARLEHQGLFTTGLLLEASETPTRRQLLADQVRATPDDVLEWRDEALLLNLAGFGPAEHDMFRLAGFDGLDRVLATELGPFREAILRSAERLRRQSPTDLQLSTWWEQARALEHG